MRSDIIIFLVGCLMLNTNAQCSAIGNSTTCFLEPSCVWLEHTQPPKCGDIGKCVDDCSGCTSESQCEEFGAGGRNPDPDDGDASKKACSWSNGLDSCIGAICATNCGSCILTFNNKENCETSFAPPNGCIYIPSPEQCIAAPTPQPSRSPTIPTGNPTTVPTSDPTLFPTGAPTDAPTDLPTTASPTTAQPSLQPTTSQPTTSLPTGSPIICCCPSDSGSDSDDGDPCDSESSEVENDPSCICDGNDSSSSEESAFSAVMIQNDIDNGKDTFVGNGNDANDDKYGLNVGFSKQTFWNVWGIFALMMLLNGICCFVCSKKKRVEQMRDIEDLNTANMEIVS